LMPPWPYREFAGVEFMLASPRFHDSHAAMQGVPEFRDAIAEMMLSTIELTGNSGIYDEIPNNSGFS